MINTKLEKVVNATFGRTFELSLTKNYVARWTASNAIRELIQNSLDSDSPFRYEFISTPNGDTLLLNSEFSSLTPQTLLLGATSKSDSEDAIGSFGEGYKVALLVLTREGYDVSILNGDFIWMPRFKMSRTYNQEVLVIDEKVAPDKLNRGLTFVVNGIDESLKQTIIDSCLLMQAHIGEVKRTKYGDILLDRPGKLYVGNLFICDTDLEYGYNILPKHLRLERDRQTVSSWDLKDITVKMWYDTGEIKRVAEMILDQVPDVSYAQYNSTELVKEECYQLFRRTNPGALIANSPEDLKQKIEDGMTKVVYIGSSAYGIISSSKSYQNELPSIEITFAAPVAVLEEWLKDNRSEMRTKAIIAFKSLITEAKKWTRK